MNCSFYTRSIWKKYLHITPRASKKYIYLHILHQKQHQKRILHILHQELKEYYLHIFYTISNCRKILIAHITPRATEKNIYIILAHITLNNYDNQYRNNMFPRYKDWLQIPSLKHKTNKLSTIVYFTHLFGILPVLQTI